MRPNGSSSGGSRSTRIERSSWLFPMSTNEPIRSISTACVGLIDEDDIVSKDATIYARFQVYTRDYLCLIYKKEIRKNKIAIS